MSLPSGSMNLDYLKILLGRSGLTLITAIMCHYKENPNREFPCSYCELEGHCKYFPNMDTVPDNEDIIKVWLMMEG